MNFSHWNLFHILTILTQEKELCSGTLFHFLMSLTQEKELFSFYTSLKQRKNMLEMNTFPLA